MKGDMFFGCPLWAPLTFIPPPIMLANPVGKPWRNISGNNRYTDRMILKVGMIIRDGHADAGNDNAMSYLIDVVEDGNTVFRI